jgi:isocitrate/isopropylmalate dehydrogenase
MVMPNLYGAIVNNTCSGITGSMGMTPGFDVGDKYQVCNFSFRFIDKAIDI